MASRVQWFGDWQSYRAIWARQVSKTVWKSTEMFKNDMLCTGTLFGLRLIQGEGRRGLPFNDQR